MTTQKLTSDGLDNREPEIGALDDTDLEKVTGGDVVLQHEKVTGAEAGRPTVGEITISKVTD